MIVLKNLTIRNFLSVGNVTQAVNFDNKDLTLILGENLDLGGDGARNGVGKTTMIQAVSYAMFGSPINNIRKDNLINRTNGKAMLVTLDFNVNGTEYKIERGRKPNLLKFYIGGEAVKDSEDSAQGENKETQVQIEKTIGMSNDMFKHIIALNTYTEPFLSMKAADQRDIIEQLMGITLLSEKAEKLKILAKETKDQVQLEEFKVKAIEEANKRVQEQIDSLIRRQKLWQAKHNEDVTNLAVTYDDLSKINIEQELLAHKELALYFERKKKQDAYEALLARQTAWKEKNESEIAVLLKSYDQLSHIDISAELQAHKYLAEHQKKKAELALLNKTIVSLQTTLAKEEKLVDKLLKEVETLKDHKCYACGQDLHDTKHDEVLSQKEALLASAQEDVAQTQNELEKNKNSVFELGLEPRTYYDTEAEAFKHNSELESILNMIQAKQNETDPYQEQVSEHVVETLGTMPKTHYDTEQEAIEHKSKVSNLLEQLEKKANEIDPYIDQIADMKKDALQEIKFDTINELSKKADHLKFLVELLTSKDSFVRKKIIDQNLSYLNSRLTHYLDKIGLPHQVVFKNDLSVEITELGRELDFGNLSRGETTRVILALSWSFRDVWENLYSPINVMFVDELLDSGIDSMGVENSLAVLKDMNRSRNKSIWLISHKDELVSRIPNTLTVIKENGFTTFSTSTDAVFEVKE
jgi:DNA repair exonuclease SbcCD ATPase subunit